MDCGNDYIKMCDCEEVQGGWELKEGDFVSWSKPFKCVEVFNIDDVEAWSAYKIRKDNGHWLPRQDQLQGMIGLSVRSTLCQFVQFVWDFLGASETLFVSNEYIKQFKSMEQLWLAFVMHELHGKWWDEGKWTKVDSVVPNNSP